MRMMRLHLSRRYTESNQANRQSKWDGLEMTALHKLQVDQPAMYTIQVQGRVADHRAESFTPLMLTVELDDEHNPVSTLQGVTADQAALHGLLRTLYSLGLPLLLVRWEKPESSCHARIDGIC
jgi:hypothetical protein